MYQFSVSKFDVMYLGMKQKQTQTLGVKQNLSDHYIL